MGPATKALEECHFPLTVKKESILHSAVKGLRLLQHKIWMQENYLLERYHKVSCPIPFPAALASLMDDRLLHG